MARPTGIVESARGVKLNMQTMANKASRPLGKQADRAATVEKRVVPQKTSLNVRGNMPVAGKAKAPETTQTVSQEPLKVKSQHEIPAAPGFPVDRAKSLADYTGVNMNTPHKRYLKARKQAEAAGQQYTENDIVDNLLNKMEDTAPKMNKGRKAKAQEDEEEEELL